MKIRRKHALGLNEPLRHAGSSAAGDAARIPGAGLRHGRALRWPAPRRSACSRIRARAYAALSPDIAVLKKAPSAGGLCNIVPGAGKIPFICFDLAGGANIAGSNVLVGGQGGQLDFLSTAGYSKLGLPGNMMPNSSLGAGSFVDRQLGLAFHGDSAFLRGILERTAVTTRANVNGTVIPALSQNDTGNNPHNPMYGIYSAGALGDLLTLIGSDSSDSGGNSLAPSYMMDPTVRPTKVDRASRRHRPGRHRQAGRTAQPGRRHGGARIDGAHQQEEARQHAHAHRQCRDRQCRRGGQGPGAVRLREGGRPRRPLRQRQAGARSGRRSADRRARPASSPRPSTTATARSARPRRS